MVDAHVLLGKTWTGMAMRGTGTIWRGLGICARGRGREREESGLGCGEDRWAQILIPACHLNATSTEIRRFRADSALETW